MQSLIGSNVSFLCTMKTLSRIDTRYKSVEMLNFFPIVICMFFICIHMYMYYITIHVDMYL